MVIEFNNTDSKLDRHKIRRVVRSDGERWSVDIPTINDITIILDNGECIIPNKRCSIMYKIGVGNENEI